MKKDFRIRLIEGLGKLILTLSLPDNERERIELLALRAGYISGDVTVNGYHNWITKIIWGRFIGTNKQRRKEMYDYLMGIKTVINASDIITVANSE